MMWFYLPVINKAVILFRGPAWKYCWRDWKHGSILCWEGNELIWSHKSTQTHSHASIFIKVVKSPTHWKKKYSNLEVTWTETCNYRWLDKIFVIVPFNLCGASNGACISFSFVMRFSFIIFGDDKYHFAFSILLDNH